MRFLRLALVLLLAFFLRGAVRRPAHFDLSANYSSRLADRAAVDKVAAQLNAWEHQLRAHGFNAIATTGGSTIKSSNHGGEERSESHDVTLVGKLDNLGRVQVRIRTDENLDAGEQAMIDLQAQRKGDYEDAWTELGKQAQSLLKPR